MHCGANTYHASSDSAVGSVHEPAMIGVSDCASSSPLCDNAYTVPSAPTALLAQALTIVMLVYRAYVAHVALRVALPTAAGIVLLDVLLAGLLKTVSDRLAG
jgi:hypothetical protein